MGFTPEEIEFLGEEELLTIVPEHRIDKLEFISVSNLHFGFYGPFRPPLPLQVPAWLAVTLKKKHKCKIRPPPWLEKEWLQERLREEVNNKDRFCALPFHFTELAEMLLDCGADDIPNAEEIRRLMKDLREIRSEKASQGLTELDGDYLRMDNLGLMEINEIRPFFRTAFNKIRKIVPPVDVQEQDIRDQMEY
ncbi:DNA replication protein psf2 [Nowakowskiella sp. JEL0407]|nr:DNA replication protein psf2 [Nowakowskiella sp. JEL0407]